MTGYITCIDCGKEVERRSPTHKRCAECAKAMEKERKDKDYAGRRGRLLERRIRRYAENREEILAQRKRYYAENREHELEARAWRYAENRESVERRSLERKRIRDAAIDSIRSGLPWTPAEDAAVMSWTEGLRELGAVLGRTRKSVGARRQKLRKRAAEQAAGNEGAKP
ncbi:hypothetical protein [Brevibacterium casei]|uniref:hypothetical protein n=1 Tax=Brevibacterium casei TaxID=33889 RepID=UPI000A3E9A82|nr:hypothetical protein [Brevibacterium casei]